MTRDVMHGCSIAGGFGFRGIPVSVHCANIGLVGSPPISLQCTSDIVRCISVCVGLFRVEVDGSDPTSTLLDVTLGGSWNASASTALPSLISMC